MGSDAYTEGVLDARRRFAEAWAEVTKQSVLPVEFSAEFLRDQLRSRWFESRSLAGGTAPVVGQRVVIVPEVAKQWGLPHAIDDLVHEIHIVFNDCYIVECGPCQYGFKMVRLAPEGSAVTCAQCAGWASNRERWRIDSEVSRATQFKVRELEAELASLRARIAEAT